MPTQDSDDIQEADGASPGDGHVGTLPGVPPAPPLPEFLVARPRQLSGEAPDPDDAPVVEEADDAEELELTDDADLVEVRSGEILTTPQQPALPLGGEGLSGPLVIPPAPPEEPPAPSALDLALAEAAGGDWSRRAADLRAELEVESDRPRAALLSYEVGELSERRLRDEAGAVKAFGRALQSDPSLRPNLWAIRRLFYRRTLWPNLLKLLDAEARFARDDRERADLLVEKAHVLEDKMGDVAGARDAYDRAIALDGASIGALLGRERQALLERDNDTLLRVWRLLADASTAPARKVGYLVDRARLLAALALAGAPDATESLLQEALDVIAEAGGLVGAPGVDPELVASERERLAEMSGQSDDLLAAGDVRIALLMRDPSRAREIVALRRRQARVARAHGDRASALRYLGEAMVLAPDEPLLCYDIADVGEEAAADGAVADALGRLEAMLPELDAPARIALALRRADALARAGREADAQAVRDELRAAAPGFLPLLVRDEREALATGELGRVAALRLEEAAAARAGTSFGPGAEHAARPTWAAAAATSAGDLFALDLGRDDDARAAYEQALEAVPGYPYAVEGLAALHTAAGRPLEAAGLLEKEAQTATGVRADEMLERLAALYETAGMLGDAQRALERLLGRRQDDTLAAFRLERLYAASGKHAERVALLAELAERAVDPARKAAISFEIARVKEDHLGDGEGAVESYRMALAQDPQDRVVRGALLAALRRSGRFGELASELRVEAELAEGDGALHALREAAAILARRLGRPEDAAGVYRELCDRAPDDLAAARGLASALAGLPDEAAPVLEREITLLTQSGDGAAAAQALVRLGDQYEALGRGEDAAAAYRRAAEAGDGVAMHAAWALAELGARHGDRAAQAQAFGGIASATSDEVVRGDLAEVLAWLASDDVEAGAEKFDDVVRLWPERRGAQLGKALLAARRNDAGELAAALTAQAERTSDPRVASALLLRAAALYEVHARQDPSASAMLATRALGLVPDDAGALIAVLERPGAGSVRAELLARRAALTTDPAMLAELQLERAELLEADGQLAAAGQALCAALAGVPGHLGALYALRRLALRAGDSETLARVSFQLGQAIGEPSVAVTHLAQAAALLDGELGRPEQGGRIWRRVFDLAPDHPVAYGRAHQVLTQTGDVHGTIEILGKKIATLGPSAGVVPFRMERQALLLHAGDVDGAAADLEAVLGFEGSRTDALMGLAEVRLLQGDARAAAELYGQYNETVTEPEQRAEGELRLARLFEQLGDRPGAIGAYEIVLTARSDDLPARERLIELLLAEGSYGRAGEEMERLAERRGGDRAARARDELRAARVYRDQAGDAARARKAYERCLAADPLGLEALRELVALFHGGDGATRAAALERAAGDVRALVTGSEPGPLKVLAAVAALAADDALTLSAAGALEALGAAGDEERRRYLQERQRVAAQPVRPRRALSDDDWGRRVEHPGVRGALADAWSCVAESAARLAGDVEPAALGFAKADRVAMKALARSAPGVEAALKVIGPSEIELWVTAGRATFARAVPLEVPLVLLSADVARAETLEARALLGRTLAAARLRAFPLEDAAVEEVALLLAAGLKAAGGDPARAPALAPFAAGMAAAKLEERSRAMARTISRKDRKTLTGLALGGDLGAWLTAVRATLRRGSLLLSGDVPLSLAGERVRGGAPSPVAVDLICYSVGESYLHLRKDLGLS